MKSLNRTLQISKTVFDKFFRLKEGYYYDTRNKIVDYINGTYNVGIVYNTLNNITFNISRVIGEGYSFLKKDVYKYIELKFYNNSIIRITKDKQVFEMTREEYEEYQKDFKYYSEFDERQKRKIKIIVESDTGDDLSDILDIDSYFDNIGLIDIKTLKFVDSPAWMNFDSMLNRCINMGFPVPIYNIKM